VESGGRLKEVSERYKIAPVEQKPMKPKIKVQR
jgi:hypothetical protein